MASSQQERNLKIYGVFDIDAYVDNVVETITYQGCGASMIIAGLMSDAQEQLQNNDSEGARKTLNIAKNILFRAADNDLIFSRGKR
jgi:hypothetical protein